MANSSPSVVPTQKFIRREDLTPSIRLYIAFTALYAKTVDKTWGTITALSKQYLISRTFVYMLAASLEQTSSIVFGANSPKTAIEHKMAYEYMLSLRLEGRCSIETTSTIMKRFGVELSSTGSISQTLNHFGSLLPDTLEFDGDEI